MLCESLFLYLMIELMNTNQDCWQPFTWQFANFILLLLIIFVPVFIFGVAFTLLICCLPCIIAAIRDRSDSGAIGE